MNTYIAIHHHRHGIETYLFQTPNEIGDGKFPNEKELTAAFQIDFEPDRDEYIDIESVNLREIATIQDGKLWDRHKVQVLDSDPDLAPMTSEDQNISAKIDWIYQVTNGDTVLGFQEWLQHKAEADQHKHASRWDERVCEALAEEEANGKPALVAKLSPDLYAARGGLRCPVCEEEGITGHSIDITDGYASQNVGCDSCPAEWTDVYQLIGYDNLEFGVKSTEEVKPIE